MFSKMSEACSRKCNVSSLTCYEILMMDGDVGASRMRVLVVWQRLSKVGRGS
jgi:hypothetical protein